MNPKLSLSSMIREQNKSIDPREKRERVASTTIFEELNAKRAMHTENGELIRKNHLLKTILIASLGLNALFGVQTFSENSDFRPIDSPSNSSYDENGYIHTMTEEELDAYIKRENELLHMEGEL